VCWNEIREVDQNYSDFIKTKGHIIYTNVQWLHYDTLSTCDTKDCSLV